MFLLFFKNIDGLPISDQIVHNLLGLHLRTSSTWLLTASTVPHQNLWSFINTRPTCLSLSILDFLLLYSVQVPSVIDIFFIALCAYKRHKATILWFPTCLFETESHVTEADLEPMILSPSPEHRLDRRCELPCLTLGFPTFRWSFWTHF